MSSTVGLPNEGRTVRMTVDNIGFMLDRLGQDCSPLQFLRELTQNSIEAIRRNPEAEGEVVWDVDWNRHTLTGIYKLACIDTGVGMTGEEMGRFINMLSSSAHQQSHDTNFGVGAKIAAATRNHAGLLYLSWKDGKGAMIHLWRDPANGQYGLQQFQRKDGTFSHWAPITDDIKPDVIDQHGTMVILLGNELSDDTMQAPPDAASPSRWPLRYLNTRYFRFPEGVVVRARQAWQHPRENTDTNLLATVTGQKPYLDSHADASGVVPLDGATAHWWILKDEPGLTQNSGHIASSGHMAALYQDELYEMVTARAGVARLQQFGVLFGYQRVVLYVAPKTNGTHQVVSNTARTHLLLNSEPLPWADWAAQFRERMPEEIAQLMDEVTAGSSSSDHRQAIKDRLKQIRDLFKVSRFKRTVSGPLTVETDTVGGKARDADRAERDGSARSGGSGGRAGDIYALFLADEGDPGEETNIDTDPSVRWISAEEGTRTPPDLDDRAAKYLPEENLLLVNRDFRGFTDMIERWWDRYDRAGGARSVIRDALEEWFEQALIETVIGVQALHGSPEWTVEDIAKALSEEALTAAVMQRYHIEMNVRRTLGSKLGSLKERVA